MIILKRLSQKYYELMMLWKNFCYDFNANYDDVIKWNICAGNSRVTREFPSQRPVLRSFDVFFDLRLNKRLSTQSWGWWFGMPSRPLWRHCNGSGHVTSLYVFRQTYLWPDWIRIFFKIISNIVVQRLNFKSINCLVHGLQELTVGTNHFRVLCEFKQTVWVLKKTLFGNPMMHSSWKSAFVVLAPALIEKQHVWITSQKKTLLIMNLTLAVNMPSPNRNESEMLDLLNIGVNVSIVW